MKSKQDGSDQAGQLAFLRNVQLFTVGLALTANIILFWAIARQNPLFAAESIMIRQLRRDVEGLKRQHDASHFNERPVTRRLLRIKDPHGVTP